ncbi:MAG: hypothetical protein M1840_000335 [Geoglossum simile]|nr:MAG: hypothetical protein M1840_000335 [Geoglossum simile]
MRASTGTLGYDPYGDYFQGAPPVTGPVFESLERGYSTSPPRFPPRRATHSAGGDGRVPPPIAIVGDRRRSPSGSRPIIHGGLGDRGLSPGASSPGDGEYYITPNVSGRRRRMYYPGERPLPGDENNRDRDMDRRHYRTSQMGPGDRRGYHRYGPLIRDDLGKDPPPHAYAGSDRDAGNPMYRRARRQRVGSLDVPPQRRERPISMAGLEDGLPPFGGINRSRSVGRGDKPSRDFTTDPNPFDGQPRGRPVSIHQRRPHTYTSSQSPMPGAFPDDGYDSPCDDEFGCDIHGDPPIEFSFRGVDDREPQRGFRDGRYEGIEVRAAQERAARERWALDEEWERHMSDAHSRDRQGRFGPPDSRDRHHSQGATSNRPTLATAAPIKGILREPRKRFPEDPEPVREGALPLPGKADHLGIPQEARWTKISRKLVNPAALEGRERFEKTDNHVIVLRVLTPDEIEMYTKITQNIREKRLADERDREYDRRRDSRRRSTIANPSRSGEFPTLHQSQQPIPPPPKPQPVQQPQPPPQQQHSPPSRGPVIVDAPRRSGTAPVSNGANGVLRPNPDVPGTFLGYRRNPPPITNSKPVTSKPAQG